MNTRKDLNTKLADLQQAAGGQRKYWQCLEELSGTEAFQELMRQEFPALADVWPDQLSRRKFLGLMGASLALAGISGCSVKPAPRGTIIPYVDQPEEVIPGIPLFFATTMLHDGNAVGLLVESHEGRPTKVEGNPDHPASLGATSIFNQASVLTLYDPARSQAVIREHRVHNWEDVASAIDTAMRRQRETGGRGLRLLTEVVYSPTLAWQIERVLEKYPEAKWHQYEPICNVNEFRAVQRAFGRSLDPVYDFREAAVVVALDADFLAAGPGHLRNARHFMERRRVRTSVEDAEQARMNRLYVAEPAVTSTGVKADHRLALPMHEIEGIARGIAASLGVAGISGGSVKHQQWIRAVARDLQEHAGECLVLAGPRQSETVHLLVHAINSHLGNVGQTVNYIRPVAIRQVDPLESLRELVRDIDQGQVEELVILGGNPAYTAPADLQFDVRLQRVPQSFHLSLYEDETSRLCTWHLPETHFLEAWSDARAFDGTASIVQPLIEPLYEGRSAHEVVAALDGERDAISLELVNGYWREYWQQLDRDQQKFEEFEEFWETALHDGLIAGTDYAPESVELQGDWATLIGEAEPAPAVDGSYELIFQADPCIYDGSYALNAWLQELPKPVTKLTWDNAAIMSPNTARELGLEYKAFAHGGEHGGYYVPKVTLEIDRRQLSAPVWIMPGHADGCVTVWLGYGRKHAARAAGEWQQTLGFDAYQLRSTSLFWYGLGLNVTPLDETYPLACTQAHHVVEDREVIRSATLEEYRHHPHHAVEQKPERHEKTLERVAPPTSLYKPFEYEPPANKWGMSIDLTTCIGCNACVVACQAENNIPVVGKEQVLFGREMHWLRIDRYIHGESSGPDEFYFQPVPCMHCEHAPCEYVCPVEATVHSAEGLNDMVYNRCVGTRFCSNNCPYKVRRFNFLSYAEFETLPLRMQYNPDVTVRSRGVMEKCSYCVQRIRQAEINAQSAERPIRDGEVLTACQAACPTQAIVFGDMNNAESTVSSWKNSPLDYSLLGELNTYPRTTYLAALRNPNPELKGA